MDASALGDARTENSALLVAYEPCFRGQDGATTSVSDWSSTTPGAPPLAPSARNTTSGARTIYKPLQFWKGTRISGSTLVDLRHMPW